MKPVHFLVLRLGVLVSPIGAFGGCVCGCGCGGCGGGPLAVFKVRQQKISERSSLTESITYRGIK